VSRLLQLEPGRQSGKAAAKNHDVLRLTRELNFTAVRRSCDAGCKSERHRAQAEFFDELTSIDVSRHSFLACSGMWLCYRRARTDFKLK